MTYGRKRGKRKEGKEWKGSKGREGEGKERKGKARRRTRTGGWQGDPPALEVKGFELINKLIK